MSSASEPSSLALVLGGNGQDGGYLAEALLARGERVLSLARQPGSRWVAPGAGFTYQALDLTDRAALAAVLRRHRPARIFHLAAVNGSAGYSYEAGWQEALAVNVASVHTCLEHIRTAAPDTRLFYASSLKAFGDPPPAVVAEATPRRSTCLYGITKNAGTDLVRHYRAKHGVWASVGYFCNHDSPRRPDSFFIPRLINHLLGQLPGHQPSPPVASLDFWCDWGSAQEFMQLAADLMDAAAPGDAVFASGHPVHAAALAAELAADLGLPAPDSPRSEPAPPFRADLSGLLAMAGRLPQLDGFAVARWMLRERLAPSVGNIPT